MKKLLLILTTFILATGCVQTNTVSPTDNILTVYTYSSLNDPDYGLLPKIIPDFEKANGVTVNVVTFADTGAMVNQLIAEKDRPNADVVIGMDNSDVARLASQQVFDSVTPFDYGYVDFVYDSQAIQFDQPISLEQLAKDSAYTGKIIIEQPGLSSPGTQLLLWSQAVFGNDSNEFWQAMNDQVLTVAPDWDTAYYTDFISGQAPIVLSYTTSPAYHIDQEGTDRYKAVPISDGYIKQTEEMAIAHGSLQIRLGQLFMDTMTSADTQNKIPTTQWMFPVGGDKTTWPAAYSEIITPTPAQELTLSDSDIAQHYDTWLQQWNSTFGL